MAVYKRTYRRYEGSLTAEWKRFLVPTRFAFEELYQSRILALLLLGAAVQQGVGDAVGAPVELGPRVARVAVDLCRRVRELVSDAFPQLGEIPTTHR